MKRLCLAVALATFALDAGGAVAQTYPNKPIRIVVPFVAGGAVDMLARMLGAKLSESLGQPVIVENRPGAGGNVAADAVAKSPPDGYTILQNTNGQAISPAIYRSLPFDVVRDFIPVTQLVASELVLAASPKLAATSVPELVALAKAKPGSLNYGMTGVGNPLHLTMEMFKTMAGVDIHGSVQGRRGDLSRPHHRRDPGGGHANGDLAAACHGWHGARARGRWRQTLGGVAQRADGRRERAHRLRIGKLARLVCAGQHTARDRRRHPAERQGGSGRTRRARASAHHRQRSRR